MRLRTQLVIAFLLLAIVPLTVIVGYSYVSSVQATREAVREEGEAMTREMDERLVSIRRELRSRLTALSAFPFRSLVTAGGGGAVSDDALLARLASSMGETAPLVEAFEFFPEPGTVESREGDGASPGPEPAPAPRAPRAPRPFVIEMQGVLEQVERSAGQAMTELERREVEAGMRAGAAVAEIFSDPDVMAGLMRGEIDEEEFERRIEESVRGLAPPEDPEPAEETAEPEAEVPTPPAPEQRAEGWAKVPDVPDVDITPSTWLGEDFELPVLEDGEIVGRVRARLSGDEILSRVLERTTEGEEIAFAVDPEGTVYSTTAENEEEVRAFLEDERPQPGATQIDDWMVVTSQDPETGLTFGIARPIRNSIEEMQQAAARNLGWGLTLTLIAMLAVLPISRRLTSRLETVTRGAERIAKGDLTARVPVSSPREVAQLAEAFNRMASELSHQRERLLREEGRRRDQELREQRLEIDFQRKKDELEQARRFQLSLLPDELPEHPGLDVAVHTETATEVGGDYYDFRTGDGSLTVAMGDATGHGALAGTMVTVVKGLFSAFPVIDDLAGFLAGASETIRGMGLERMRMAFALARFEGDTVRFASGGMPPALIRRANGTVEEIVLPGMPLGGLPFPYEERRIDLSPGDAVLLMSDGLAELADVAGRPFGYDRIHEILERSESGTPEGLLTELVEAGRKWAGEGPPPDDVTLMVVRKG